MRAVAIAVALAACAHPAPRPSAQRSYAAAKETALRLTGQPLPPMQLAAWTPPAGDLPPELVAAVAEAFDRGLADPRGLPYREITIVVGDIESASGLEVKTEGWVFADDRWAIAWNGLIYPVVSVGAAAELPRALAPDVADVDEETAVCPVQTSAIKAALLLRVGQPLAAMAAWDARKLPDDPLRLIMTEWLWALFDRATAAHARGDDAIAHASTRLLAAVGDPVRAELRARDRAGFDSITFLDGLPALAADQDRRATRPLVVPHMDHRAFVALPEASRVSLLVDWLDQVAARRTDSPGSVELAHDPIVAALIALGPAAVEPLLAVVDSDTRLTRSVEHSDSGTFRVVIPVRDAALAALNRIIVISPGSDASGVQLTSDNARALARTYPPARRSDRWYGVLADDAASPAQWAWAAESITRTADADVWFRDMPTTAVVFDPHELAGESLRAASDPSVTELMVRRARAVPDDPAAGCMIAEALATWDPAPPPDVIAGAMDVAIAHTAAAGAACVVDLTRTRLSLGDTAALGEYLAWLDHRDPHSEEYDSFLFDPLFAHIDDPSATAVASRIFAEGSLWRPTWRWHNELVASRALVVPQIADAVLDGLRDTNAAARVTADGGMIWIEPNGGAAYGISRDDDLTDPVDQSVRVCDLIASDLASDPGAPAFELTWPVSKRDDGVAAMIAWVGTVR